MTAGARLIDGTLFLAGPTGTVFALGADGLAALASDTRTLRPEEYELAQLVFKHTLPARDDILVSDGKGAGGKPFTYPRFDNKMILNVGATWKSDLRELISGRCSEYGQFLVHELVHVWQYHNNDAAVSYLADAFWTKVFNDDYDPGVELNEDWDSFGIEEQGAIVDEWFARHYQGPGHWRVDARGRPLPTLTADEEFGLASPAAVEDQAFPYITNHIRLGNN